MDQLFKIVGNKNLQTQLAKGDSISLIAFLARTEEINNIESYSKIIHLCFSSLSDSDLTNELSLYLNVLKQCEENTCIIVCNKEEKFNLFVHDKWLFKVIVLVSLRHIKCLINQKTVDEFYCNSLNTLLGIFIQNLKVNNVVTLHLLRVLEIILKKHSSILKENLTFEIIKCMNFIALSPITGFKYYAHSISKILLKNLPQETLCYITDISVLPIRGVDTSDLVKVYFSKHLDSLNDNFIIKVIRLFENNVDSRDGGFLYEVFLNYDFDMWKIKVWPLFCKTLEQLEYEGEYFQSLVKYWIPTSVKRYQNYFYEFLSLSNVNEVIKALALYETRKQGFYIIEYDKDLEKFIKNQRTRHIALKIISTYIKKSFQPSQTDLKQVLYLLYSTTETLNDEKILRQFFSHLFFFCHNLNKKGKKNNHFEEFIENIYGYICSMFEINSDLASQILRILLDSSTCSSDNLYLLYKLEKGDFYGVQENLFYLNLLQNDKWHFKSGKVKDLVRKWFEKTDGSSDYLTKLILERFYEDITLNLNLPDLIESLSKTPNLQACHKMHNFACIALNMENSNEILENYRMMLNENFLNCDENLLFVSVLHLEVILVALRLKIEISNFEEILEKTIDTVEEILDDGHFKAASNRTFKVLEAFINNILIFIQLHKNPLKKSQKNKIFLLLTKIIQMSDMKRPVSLSIEILKQFASLDENDEDKNLKVQFLVNTLTYIYQTPDQLNMKIRRNPECRLVIHALCSSEKNTEKPLLNWAMGFLLDVLSDEVAPDSSIASAFHCLELLISDNTIQNHTLSYVPAIIEHSVRLFANTNWSVRNALIQLVKVIIERFLGVSTSRCTRPKTIEDVLLMFPRISTFFDKFLQNPTFSDLHVVIFLYFSESQYKRQVFVNAELDIVRSSFEKSFHILMNQLTGCYGTLVSLSFVSICLEKDIPQIFDKIVLYIINENFGNNFLKNWLTVLEELYKKYIGSFDHCTSKLKLTGVQISVAKLLTFLKGFNRQLFDFLLFKVNSAPEILSDQTNKCCANYLDRIWYHNNIPFVFANVKENLFCAALKETLNTDVMNCIQVKILSIILDKLDKSYFRDLTISYIINILANKMMSFNNNNNNNNYISICYFKTILVLFESCDSFNFDPTLRQFYITTDLYKVIILIAFLSKFKEKIINDFQFIHNSVHFYKNNLFPNEDIAYDIATTLQYLYICLNDSQDKLTVLKIAFFLLLKNHTCKEICSFFCIVNKKSYSSVLQVINDFLGYKNLLMLINDALLVGKFLHSVYKFVHGMENDFLDSDTFYLVETDVVVPKIVILRILHNSIAEYMRVLT